MDQLPAKFLLSLFRLFNRVVASNVLVKGANGDHGDHSGQEENDDQGVHNCEPLIKLAGDDFNLTYLNISVRHRVQNVIPAGGPLYVVVSNKRYGVSVLDGCLLVNFRRNFHRLALVWIAIEAL